MSGDDTNSACLPAEISNYITCHLAIWALKLEGGAKEMPHKWIILIWTNVCVPGSPGVTEWDLFQHLQEKSNNDQRRELGRSPSFMGI